MPIQRYDWATAHMTLNAQGGYVCYSTHLDVVAALQAKLAALDGQRCETCAMSSNASPYAIYCTFNSLCILLPHGCRAWEKRED